MLNILLQKIESSAPKLCYQSVRYRGKFNSRYPRPRHDIPRYLEEITKPVLIKEKEDQVQKCKNYMKNIEDLYKFDTKSAIDFEQFLAKHCAKLIKENEAMIICHQHFATHFQKRLNLIELKKKSMEIWHFNTTVMKLFIEQNSKYENLSTIVETALGTNAYIFVKKVSDLPVLLQLLRKMPQLVLLGGLVQDNLLTRSDVQRLSQLERTELSAQVLGTINQNVMQNLSLLQNPIVNLLFTFETMCKKDSK